MKHKAGFINIVGLPNVGKSTLMNTLVGEKMSIITSKAQTTRHRIVGILNEEHYQIVLSDTPGFIRDPASKLHEAMNRFVDAALDDADAFIFLTHPFSKPEDEMEIIKRLKKANCPVYLVLNKIDLIETASIKPILKRYDQILSFDKKMVVSAMNGEGVDALQKLMIKSIPVHPPYFDKDALTDRPERFFVSEIIREKIFLNYKKEIPYSAEVGVDSFKEEEKLIRIRSIIYVERKTQKSIIIGKGGEAIKKVGIEARKDIEAFLGKQVYLELFVKVKEKWRSHEGILRSMGYE